MRSPARAAPSRLELPPIAYQYRTNAGGEQAPIRKIFSGTDRWPSAKDGESPRRCVSAAAGAADPFHGQRVAAECDQSAAVATGKKRRAEYVASWRPNQAASKPRTRDPLKYVAQKHGRPRCDALRLAATNRTSVRHMKTVFFGPKTEPGELAKVGRNS